jgi:hypothetical protein
MRGAGGVEESGRVEGEEAGSGGQARASGSYVSTYVGGWGGGMGEYWSGVAVAGLLLILGASHASAATAAGRPRPPAAGYQQGREEIIIARRWLISAPRRKNSGAENAKCNVEEAGGATAVEIFAHCVGIVMRSVMKVEQRRCPCARFALRIDEVGRQDSSFHTVEFFLKCVRKRMTA